MALFPRLQSNGKLQGFVS